MIRLAKEGDGEEGPGCADSLLRQSQREGQDGKIDPLIGRRRGQPHHPDPLPPVQEQPAVSSATRCRQDGNCRGPGQAHRRGRRAGSALRCGDLSLDMGVLLAGTRYRGDFEERLKQVVKEIEDMMGAVMFIDEIHTVIGAGATSGGAMDASNLLKPALSSGASVASVRPPTRNIASSSRRTARWCAGSRRSMSMSRRCPMRSRS
jgi:ATP-dependent Clp protease ATP-binding subunit ClpA